MVTGQLIMQEVDRVSGDCLYLDETDRIDVTPILDTFDDDALPEEIEQEWQFQEDIAYQGMEMGLLPQHEGPFEMWIDEEEYHYYRADRLGIEPTW